MQTKTALKIAGAAAAAFVAAAVVFKPTPLPPVQLEPGGRLRLNNDHAFLGKPVTFDFQGQRVAWDKLGLDYVVTDYSNLEKPKLNDPFLLATLSEWAQEPLKRVNEVCKNLPREIPFSEYLHNSTNMARIARLGLDAAQKIRTDAETRGETPPAWLEQTEKLIQPYTNAQPKNATLALGPAQPSPVR